MNRRYRDDILEDVVLQRLSVFLHGDSGAFSGILTRFNGKTYVFEECQSVPTKDGETAVPYRGRVLVAVDKVKYLVDAS